jgi:hypothetical protein
MDVHTDAATAGVAAKNAQVHLLRGVPPNLCLHVAAKNAQVHSVGERSLTLKKAT